MGKFVKKEKTRLLFKFWGIMSFLLEFDLKFSNNAILLKGNFVGIRFERPGYLSSAQRWSGCGHTVKCSSEGPCEENGRAAAV